MFNNWAKILKKEFDNIEAPNVLLKGKTYDICKRNTSKMKRKTLLQSILILCIAIVVILSSAFAINTELRNLIISFFKSSIAETIPKNLNSEEVITYVGKQSIDGIANIRYYEINGESILNNNIVSVRVDDGMKYYKISDEKIKELLFESTHVSDTIYYKGIKFPLDFNYGMLAGKIFTESTFDNIAKPYVLSIVGQYGTEHIWVELGMQQSSQYYVLYNLKTRKTTDVIKEALGYAPIIEQFEISPNGKKIIVGSEEFYFLDIEEKMATSINKITLLDHIVSCTFVNDDLVSITQKNNEIEQSVVAGQIFSYNSYSYNFTTAQKYNVFKDEKFYNPYIGITNGYIALGNGFYVQKTTEQYVLVTPFGEKYPIANIKPSDCINFLLNQNYKKIAVVNISGKGNDGLKITELGLIDIQKKELKIFDRKDFNNNYETSIFWNDNDSLAVTATNQNNYLYVYQFIEN